MVYDGNYMVLVVHWTYFLWHNINFCWNYVGIEMNDNIKFWIRLSIFLLGVAIVSLFVVIASYFANNPDSFNSVTNITTMFRKWLLAGL